MQKGGAKYHVIPVDVNDIHVSVDIINWSKREKRADAIIDIEWLPTVPSCKATGLSSCIILSFATRAKSWMTDTAVLLVSSSAYASSPLTLTSTAMQ
jgi:hypothetical protein